MSLGWIIFNCALGAVLIGLELWRNHSIVKARRQIASGEREPISARERMMRRATGFGALLAMLAVIIIFAMLGHVR